VVSACLGQLEKTGKASRSVYTDSGCNESVANGEGSNDKICWGMAWHADGKLEVAFDCDATFRGATGIYRHGMDPFGSGCGCVVLACLGQLERTPRRGQSKQECLHRFRMQ